MPELNRRKLTPAASAAEGESAKPAKSRKKRAKTRTKFDEKTFTESLIKQDHTPVQMEQIKELVDYHLGTMKADPLVALLQSIKNEDNALAQTHKVTWHLIRLLCMRAVSRMGTRAPVNARGLPIYPLTENETAMFNKLAQTVTQSKKTLLEMRKLRLQEEALDREAASAAINITPQVFSDAELQQLMEIATKEDETK